jgi:hypothetical protein
MMGVLDLFVYAWFDLAVWAVGLLSGRVLGGEGRCIYRYGLHHGF